MFLGEDKSFAADSTMTVTIRDEVEHKSAVKYPRIYCSI